MLIMRNTNKLNAHLTTCMGNDVRANAQTTIALTPHVRTFMRTDVRADAQTTIKLDVSLTIFTTTDVRADAKTTIKLTAQLTSEWHCNDSAALVPCSLRLEPIQRNNGSTK